MGTSGQGKNQKLNQRAKKGKGGNRHGFNNPHHCHRCVGSVVRRRRFLLESPAVALPSHLLGKERCGDKKSTKENSDQKFQPNAITIHEQAKEKT
jgi:hypothetical protein